MVRLTARQERVLRCTIIDDLTYRETAARLGLSAHTVQAHVVRAYASLGVAGGSKRDAALALGWGWPPREPVAA